MGIYNLPQAIQVHDDYKLSLVGTHWPTINYGEIVVLQYNNNNDVKIQFVDTGNIRKASLANIRVGRVKDTLCDRRKKLIYGVGYIGLGKYSKSTHKFIYDKWICMLSRCYSPKNLEKEPAYKSCTVCKEWHNFQNFATWFEAQEFSDEKYHLDKDVIDKNSHVYSPNTCLLLPGEINRMFVKRKRCRGNTPIGVYCHPQCKHKPYMARCGNTFGFPKTLGAFDNPVDAFNAYKIAKEQIIKYAANLYKEKLSSIAYQALINYSVDITD